MVFGYLLSVLISIPMWFLILLGGLSLYAYSGKAWPILRRVRYVLPVVMVVVYLASAPAVSNALARSLEDEYNVPEVVSSARGDGNVILVLTDGWSRRTVNGYEMHFAEAGWERLETAIKLYDKIGGSILITGAPSYDGKASIAGEMGRVAQRWGIPREHILIEPTAPNTYFNIVRSIPMLPQGTKRVWLVTSARHMPRAMAVARKQGLAAIAYPCDFRAERRISWIAWLPSNHGIASMERTLHEIVGLAAYRARGWAE